MNPIIRNLGLVALLIVLQISNSQGTSSSSKTGRQRSTGQVNATIEGTTSETSREEKFLSLFSIVRFPNSVCTGTNSYNGTCLTSAECSSYGGSGAGTCASGFGVCCIVVFQTCGASTSLNNTYWQSAGFASAYTTAGQCSFSVNKYSSDVEQLRVDFYSFTLSGPETTAASTIMGQCSIDSFTVLGSSNSVPAICGNNTYQHIYVNYPQGTNTLTFNIITTGNTFSRFWNIRFTQIPGYQSYTAPSHCLQWYTDVTGTLKSFNFLSAAAPVVQHLAYQDYTICIRSNQGFCGIGYAICSSSYPSFGISTSSSGLSTSATILDAGCAYDWIMIPCASDQLNNVLTIAGSGCASKICGIILSTTLGSSSNIPIYSYRRPFEVRFYTDANEQSTTTGATESIGFCLTYTQQPCLSVSSTG